MQKGISILILLIIGCTKAIASPHYHFQNIPSLKKTFNAAIKDHAFPGGCIAIGGHHQLYAQECFGYYTYDKKRLDKKTSEFDIASLTKVVATTPAIMKLYEEHKLNLDDKVVQYLPEFKGPTAHQTQLKATITIRDLLTHSSGLPADNYVKTWLALYQTPLEARPHERTIYSDVNFALLGKIVEKISGLNLNEYTHRFIFKPLGMNHTYFKPNLKHKKNIVPTEYSGEKHEFFRGIVADPLARDFEDVSGNAGLFSTLQDLSIFAKMMLNNGVGPQGRFFKASTVHLYTTRAYSVKNSTRTLGWDTAYLEPNLNKPEKIQHQFTAGLYIDAEAYGHSGYTGTSLWISPKNGIFVLLLTNRVFPHISQKNQAPQRYWRQQIDSAAWEDLGFHKKNPLYVEPAPNKPLPLWERSARAA